jgi:hypothetical protein
MSEENNTQTPTIVEPPYPTKSTQFEPLERIINEVVKERVRQVQEEGYSFEVDDHGQPGRLAGAAASYSVHSAYVLATGNTSVPGVPEWWPFSKEHWKPKDVRSNLIRAIALNLAEIEKIDRNTGIFVPE